tara:strand:- start:134 stop:586 length:453 start_codon:yes stop_codon:yes gene_type:complete
MESMLEYFYNEFGKKVSKEFIKDTIQLFTDISSFIRFEDLEGSIREFIMVEIQKIELKILINQTKNRLQKKSKHQYSLLNHSILEKRSNGDLFRYLRTLKKKELDTLRQLVDISDEYRIIDREISNNSKFGKSGRSYGLMDGKNDITTYV